MTGTTSRLPVGSLALMLLRGRAAAGRAVIDVLAVATFALTSSLLLSVVAGARAFHAREAHPPAAFVQKLGDQAAQGVGQLPMWTFLAVGAALLLVVPLLTLSSAAARMGALGRDQRLATLRLLGVSSGGAVLLAATETMAAAVIGCVLGTLGYLALLPVWTRLVFQETPLTVPEMLLPASWIAVVLAAVVLLAGAAAVAGLREVRISPLGVARRTGRRRLRWQRLLLVPAILVAWVALAPLLDFTRATAFAVGATFVALTCFMGVVNLIGPLVLQLAGQVMVRSNSTPALLAGRRLLDDPRGAWRSVAGLAFVGFTGGSLIALPTVADPADRLGTILIADIRTGTLLTLVIAFVVAAASTALNQAVGVLDRRATLVQLDHAGAQRSLVHDTRRRQVLVPTAIASLGSAGLAAAFFMTLGATSGIAGDITGPGALAVVLALGLALVVGASESCRPLVRGILAGAGPRVD